jgi:hypothetical protein
MPYPGINGVTYEYTSRVASQVAQIPTEEDAPLAMAFSHSGYNHIQSLDPQVP